MSAAISSTVHACTQPHVVFSTTKESYFATGNGTLDDAILAEIFPVLNRTVVSTGNHETIVIFMATGRRAYVSISLSWVASVH